MPTYRASTETVACTLTVEDLKDTQAAWQKLFDAALVARDEIPEGLRLEFVEGGADALASLIEIERECCPWITFRLEGPVVEMTAVADAEATLREMWRYDPGSKNR